MSHNDQLTRHLAALAEAAVPADLRPDPPLSARVRGRAGQRAGSRRRGLATLAAALILALLGLVVLASLPGDGLTTAAQGPTLAPTETPLPPQPVALALDAEAQMITLGEGLPAVLLDLPDAPSVLSVAVEGASAGGPMVVGYRPDARPLFSFDPALTRDAAPGTGRVARPGASVPRSERVRGGRGADPARERRGPAGGTPRPGKPCPCRKDWSPWRCPIPCTGRWSPARRWTSM